MLSQFSGEPSFWIFY